MIIDNISIIIATVLVVLAILSVLTSPFIKARKALSNTSYEDDDEKTESEKLSSPNISIIIPAHDNSYELEHNLPSFLSQQYDANYKVIVVADKGDTETEDLLKRMASPHLYTTYLPLSSRYMSRTKLAITIGVKAAETEWVIVTSPYCKPTDNNWLHTVASQLGQEDLAMGYVKMNEENKAYRRFEHIFMAHIMFNSAMKQKAWGTNMALVAIRKKVFIENNGFLGNLQLLRGEYDFLVNKYGTSAKTILSPSSWLQEEELTDREWKNRHSYFQASRKLLKRMTVSRTKLFFFHLLLHTSLLASIAIGTIAGLQQNWILLGAAGLGLLINIIGHTCLATREVHRVDNDIAIPMLYFYQLSLLWHSIGYRIHYIMADKTDFTSHKL